MEARSARKQRLPCNQLFSSCQRYAAAVDLGRPCRVTLVKLRRRVKLCATPQGTPPRPRRRLAAPARQCPCAARRCGRGDSGGGRTQLGFPLPAPELAGAVSSAAAERFRPTSPRMIEHQRGELQHTEGLFEPEDSDAGDQGRSEPRPNRIDGAVSMRLMATRWPETRGHSRRTAARKA